MSFFDQPTEPDEPPREDPVWLGPPVDVLGVPVPLSLVLARTDELAVALQGLTAYPTGFELRLRVGLRRADVEVEPLVFHPRRGVDAFHFGVQFADGRKATTHGSRRRGRPFPEQPEQPTLFPRGGGGGPRSWDAGFWVWGLPPAGPLALVCAWAARGIEETRVEVDAGAVLEAAARARPIWL